MQIKGIKSETLTCPYCWYVYGKDKSPMKNHDRIICNRCSYTFKFKSETTTYYTVSKLEEG